MSFKMIPGFDGRYKINIEGEVLGVRGQPLKTYRDNGYVCIMLRKKGTRRTYKQYVHRLIYAAFVGDIGDKHIDHIDRNKANNKISNLRICTQSENLCNATAKKGRKYKGTGVYKTKKGKHYRATLRKEGRIYRRAGFTTEEEAALSYNLMAVALHRKYAELNNVYDLDITRG